MKLLSNKTYKEMKDDIKSHRDMYNQEVTALMLENKDLELKIQTISDRLIDILNFNSKTSKQVILGHVKGIVKFIQKGE